jgi:hypothetical protein
MDKLAIAEPENDSQKSVIPFMPTLALMPRRTDRLSTALEISEMDQVSEVDCIGLGGPVIIYHLGQLPHLSTPL